MYYLMLVLFSDMHKIKWSYYLLKSISWFVPYLSPAPGRVPAGTDG